MKTAEFKKLIAAISELNHQQRNSLLTALNQQVNKSKILEIIEASFDGKHICPHCSGAKLYRHRLASGLQRYYCKSCKRTFNALTCTPLAHLRHKQKWLDYLNSMAESLTVRRSAANANVHRNTSFRWRHRFLRWLSQDRPATLHGFTEADETYLLESYKGERKLERKARKRGGTAARRVNEALVPSRLGC
jgi:transposase-like protein